MSKPSHDDTLVNARILYWGAHGSGKSENLRTIYHRLRPDHCGSLKTVPTRTDPTIEYEVLPVELDDVGGPRTAIEIIAVPGAADQAPTRKRLLDEADGIVLVIDSQAERIADNEASLQELRDALSEHGRHLKDIPLVIQYNKRDLSDPYTFDELHRRLDVGGAAVVEAVATEATGVLETLSTLSKHVVRTLHNREFDVTAGTGTIDSAPPTLVDSGPIPDSATEASNRMQEAILAEVSHPESDAIVDLAAQAESLLDASWLTATDSEIEDDLEGFEGIDSADVLEPKISQPPRLGPELSIASVGEATRSGDRAVRVPLVLADKEGRSSTLVLTISLDPLHDESPYETPD